MRVAFLAGAPERGAATVTGIVAGHAARLRADHGVDAVLVLAGQDAGRERFDVAVATWWDVAPRLAELDARRSARLIMIMEDRLLEPGSPEAAAAAASHVLGVPTITGARWIAEQVEALTDGAAPVHLLRHGIDKAIFAVASEAAPGGTARCAC